MRQTVEGDGANCAHGGVKLESGIDENADGVLQDGEVDSTTYICNGADGSAANAVKMVVHFSASNG